jgi:hypothetical protein
MAALISASMRSLKLIDFNLALLSKIRSLLQILNFFISFFQVYGIFIDRRLDRAAEARRPKAEFSTGTL